MISSTFQQAAICFSGNSGNAVAHDLEIVPIKGGLINQSYIVKSPGNTSFLLQQINKNVFKDPEAVQNNYLKIWSQNKQMRLPSPILLSNKLSLYIDVEGQYWRAFEFIEGTFSPAVAANSEQAYATGKTFGSFAAAFRNFDAGTLDTTIPDFHNLSLRFDQYQSARKQADKSLIHQAGESLDKLSERSGYKDFYQTVITHPQYYPKRVMHHDAKIANVLFDKQSGAVVCPVDFDTVMPGYFFSDLGDMIRSMACNHDENYLGTEPIQILPDYYHAIVEGYLSVMKVHLTGQELEHIHNAGLIMIYMQALRFMTDFLQHDTYYHTDYPTQNLDRANNQLQLLISLESFLKKNTTRKEFVHFDEK